MITNWTGIANTVASVNTDRVIFNTPVSNAELAFFSFAGYADGATQFNLGNGFFEIVPLAPVPEPSTCASGLLAMLAVGYQQRRRLLAPSRKLRGWERSLAPQPFTK